MEDTKKCPKCGGNMEEGMTKHGFGGSNTWIKKGKSTIFGAPQYISYSCLRCGFIESYVDRPPTIDR